MKRLLLGRLHGAGPDNLDEIAQELADATLGAFAVSRVLLERSPAPGRPRRLILIVDRPANDTLRGRYELRPQVWLQLDAVRPAAALSANAWCAYDRHVPIPKARASRAR